MLIKGVMGWYGWLSKKLRSHLFGDKHNFHKSDISRRCAINCGPIVFFRLKYDNVFCDIQQSMGGIKRCQKQKLTGHIPHIEQPKDLAEVIEDFIRK